MYTSKGISEKTKNVYEKTIIDEKSFIIWGEYDTSIDEHIFVIWG